MLVANVVSPAFAVRGASVRGDGLFFNWGIITPSNGLQALRLMATPRPPVLTAQRVGAVLQLSYPTNYVGYSLQSAPALSPANWTTLSTGTNVVTLSPSDANRFFRLSKP